MGYILTGRDEDGNEYLMHYGTKGMKWGKRKVLSLLDAAKNGINKKKEPINDYGNGHTVSLTNKELLKTQKAANRLAKKVGKQPYGTIEIAQEVHKKNGKYSDSAFKSARRFAKGREMEVDAYKKKRDMADRANYSQSHMTDYERRQFNNSLSSINGPVGSKVKKLKKKKR